jgi:hypothetical protein
VSEPTAKQKAAFARKALKVYAKQVGGEVDDTGLADLLADLMFLCDQEEWDFYYALARAGRYYKDECAEGTSERTY